MGVSVCPPHSHSHSPNHSPNHIHNQTQPHTASRIQDGRGEGVRIEMPVPCPSPVPTPGLGVGAAHAKLVMVWAESAVRRLCDVRGVARADALLMCVGRGRGGSMRGLHVVRWPLVCASWRMERKFIKVGVPANPSCGCRSLVTGHSTVATLLPVRLCLPSRPSRVSGLK